MSANRVIAITGGSAGIGRATAIGLARAGHAVAICARRVDKLEAAARQIREDGGKVLTVRADVSRFEDVEQFVAATVEHFGTLDVMVCNAGFAVAGAIDDITPPQMRALMDVNYMGTFYAARAALRLFRRKAAGHIVIVSSIVGRRGVPYMGAYSATKFAQVGMAECLRAEVAGTGIQVTVIYPVSTETEFFDVMSRETGTTVSRIGGPRQDVATVAAAIIRAIEHPVPEVFPHFQSRALIWVNTFAPGFTDRLVKRFGRKPLRREHSADPQ
jgi:short-subunit dehydrogenase